MKTLRSSLSSLIYHSKQWFGRTDAGVRILCYHRVNDQDRSYLSVPISDFEEQMRFLWEHEYETVSLAVPVSLPLVARNGGGKKPIVITFDDGYRDNYENAFPIMSKFGFKGVIFLIVDRMGSDHFLTKDQIKEMSQAGFEFGSHSRSHLDLASLEREGKYHEISSSKSLLSNELGMDIRFFCYPCGRYDQESVASVKEAGYLGACSNDPGSNNGKCDPYLLKRTEIAPHDSLYDFEKKLAGAYDWVHKTLHVIRGRP
ncbi:MAG: polysaccharide deacetylase family protein [Candidatus Omnitrophica bacterium]|nr:polysaccharide deacetylase family protein [Candidatus Omnitrophota bacterium]